MTTTSTTGRRHGAAYSSIPEHQVPGVRYVYSQKRRSVAWHFFKSPAPSPMKLFTQTPYDHKIRLRCLISLEVAMSHKSVRTLTDVGKNALAMLLPQTNIPNRKILKRTLSLESGFPKGCPCKRPTSEGSTMARAMTQPLVAMQG